MNHLARDTPIQDVYVDADGFTEYFQSANQDPRAVDDIRTEAQDRVRAKLIREELRKHKRTWRKELAQVRQQVQQELQAQPVYLALANLQNGKLPDGSPLPQGMPAIKLDRDELARRWGKDILRLLPGPNHPLALGRPVYTRGGMAVDQAAELLGFNTGDALIGALQGVVRLREAVRDQADQIMRDRHGDLIADGRLQQEAERALSSRRRAEVLRMELSILFNKRRELFNKQVHRMADASPSVAQVRQHAQRQAGRQTVREMKPAMYQAAARRAGREARTAFLKGDHNEAFRWKYRELLNLELERATRQAQRRTAMIRRYMRRFDKPALRQRIGKAGDNYLKQIDAFGEQFEFLQVTGKKMGRRASLLRFIERQQELDSAIELNPGLINDASTTNWQQVSSYDRLVEMYENVKQIEHQANLKNQLLASEDKRRFDDARQQMLGTIEENVRKLPAARSGMPCCARSTRPRTARWP